jgi:hypothetical protein
MAIALASKPGLSSTTTLSIPATWNATWFRNLISNQLKGADVRNAVGVNGIVVSGNIASPYATIGFGAPVTLPGQVTITAPSAAVPTLVVYQTDGTGTNPGILIQGTGGNQATLAVAGSGITQAGAFEMQQGSGGDSYLWNYSNNFIAIGTNNTLRLTVAGTGAITVSTPSAGTALTLNAATGQYGLEINGTPFAGISLVSGGGTLGTTDAYFYQGATDTRLGTRNTTPLRIETNGYDAIVIGGNGGVTMPSPTSTVTTLTVNGVGPSNYVMQIGAGSANNTVAILYLSNGSSAAGIEAIRIDNCAKTGAGTATFTATNKPTATAGGPVTWIPINLDGGRRYIPVWA